MLKDFFFFSTIEINLDKISRQNLLISRATTHYADVLVPLSPGTEQPCSVALIEL